MPDIAILCLAAIAILMVKHTAADFFLQTPYQYCNKGTYGHPAGTCTLLLLPWGLLPAAKCTLQMPIGCVPSSERALRPPLVVRWVAGWVGAWVGEQSSPALEWNGT